MELTGKYRHELKYSISLADRMALVQRLRPLMQRDPHTDETGRYTIRSVYFDNYKDKALREKLSGVQTREKFRIRYYNEDLSFITLEKKIKHNDLCKKLDAPLTAEEYQRIFDGSYRKKYELIKEQVYCLKEILDIKSKTNRQFLIHMQNDIDIDFFQILDRKQIKMKRQKEIKETASNFDMVSIQEHGWSRTEIAIIKNIANAYRDDKKVEIAISILRKAIESFDKETIGQENACLGKQLLWETLATYLGDVEKYEEAILYAKKGMEKIFENGSAK